MPMYETSPETEDFCKITLHKQIIRDQVSEKHARFPSQSIQLSK